MKLFCETAKALLQLSWSLEISKMAECNLSPYLLEIGTATRKLELKVGNFTYYALNFQYLLYSFIRKTSASHVE